MKNANNKKLFDKQKLKEIFPYLMIALIWTLFSLWICIFSHEALWSIFLVPIGFIPLIWEIYISPKFQYEYQSQNINTKKLIDKSNIAFKVKDPQANLSNYKKVEVIKKNKNWEILSEKQLLKQQFSGTNDSGIVIGLSENFNSDSYSIIGQMRCHGCYKNFDFKVIAKKGGTSIKEFKCPACFNDMKIYSRELSIEGTHALSLVASPQSQLKSQAVKPIVLTVNNVIIGEIKEAPIEEIFNVAKGSDSKRFTKLIEQLSDVNIKDELDISLLIYACGNHLPPVVDLLITKGANLNYRSRSGAFPLMSAISMGNLGNVKLLIEAGVDVNLNKNNSGYTALMQAIHGTTHRGEEEKYLEIVRLLLSNGAEINVSSNDGKNPLQMAKESGNQAVIDALTKPTRNNT